jgi:predicted anti-sigma-YlaC factor YlaD
MSDNFGERARDFVVRAHAAQEAIDKLIPPTKHVLDVDLVEMAEHLRVCSLCRGKFARVMYDVIT